MSKLKKAEIPKKKGKAYLFGPFAGEVDWEFYRFAPHSIYLKKQDPTIKIIVLTRKERFDLYGKYANILVPLNIKNENEYKSSAFGLIDYKTEYYYTIKKFFYEKYNNVRLHGSIANLSPRVFWDLWQEGNITRRVLKNKKVKFNLNIPYQQLSGNMNLREVPCSHSKTLDGFEGEKINEMFGAESFLQPSV